jgi:hypothetical protein
VRKQLNINGTSRVEHCSLAGRSTVTEALITAE